MDITTEGFIRVDFTPEMIETATAKAKDLGVLKNSIRKGMGNLVGFLGEEMVLVAFPGAKSENTYQHDISLPGITIEVKSKDRTVAPRLDYDASVANYNTSQRADYYVFTSIFRNKATGEYTHGHIIGMIEKERYKSMATFWRKGEIDPSNGWEVSADCYNVSYRDLKRFD
jgi:hypothetical protein